MSFLQPGTSSRKNVTFLYTQFSLLITKLNQKRGKKRSVWFQQFFCQIVTKQWNRNRNRNVVRKSLRLIKIINYISKICSIIRNERRDSNRTFSIHFDIYLPSSMMSGQLMCERSFYSAKRLSSKAILSYFVVGYASMRKHQRRRRLLVNFNSKKITTKFWRFYGLCFFLVICKLFLPKISFIFSKIRSIVWNVSEFFFIFSTRTCRWICTRGRRRRKWRIGWIDCAKKMTGQNYCTADCNSTVFAGLIRKKA